MTVLHRDPCYNEVMCVIKELHCIINMFKYRESYRSAHALVNLLNKLRKRDKMRGLQ